MTALPVPFALCGRGPEGEATDEVLAVGMILPDGRALTVDWRGRRAGDVRFWPSAQHSAAGYAAAGYVRPEQGVALVWPGTPARSGRPPTNRPTRW